MRTIKESGCLLTGLVCDSFLILTANKINLIEVVAFLRQKFLSSLIEL